MSVPRDAWGRQPRPYALLGWPVGHSLSPAMHNAAFREQGIQAIYVALAVPPEELDEAVRGLASLGFGGANVTIPHKEAVLGYLDEVTPEALLIGAVNTIVCRDGRLTGHNTDGQGFLRHLYAEGIDPAGQNAVILGAGGAARAVAAALAGAGVRTLVVAGRTPERAEAVAGLARRAASAAGMEVEAAPVALPSREAELALADAHLVVNCTPVGMAPATGESPLPDGLGGLRPGTVVYDTVYRPPQTRLLRDARARALVTIGGLGMLVHQGALAWELWFGRPGPVPVMWAAAEAALTGED